MAGRLSSGGGGRLSSGGGGRLVSPQQSTDIQSLGRLGINAGLGDQVAKITTPPQNKLSTLQRIVKGLSALNPAEAVITGMEQGSFGAGLKEYGTNIVQGIGSAITGTDYEGRRSSFADVAEKLGVHNGIARFGIGFAGDVLLDPSTYFGGAIAKGIGKGLGKAGSVALKGVGKVAPETEAGLRMAGTGLKDALGRAFKFGYKSSKGASDDVLTFMSKKEQAKLGLAASNLNRLGTGVLTESQQKELALALVAGKRAEFTARQAALLPQGVFKGRSLEFVAKEIATSADPIKGASGGLKAFQEMGIEPFINGKINPQVAVGRISDVVQKLDQVKPGLGALIKLDPNNVTVKELEAAGRKALESISLNADDVARAGVEATDVTMKGLSPELQTVAQQQLARSQKIGKGLGLENPYEVYFPFLKNDRVDNFIKQTSGLKVGSQGYLKQFKNLLTNENIELNPAKAFFTSEAQVATDRMTGGFLNGFVKKYGKALDAFDNSDDAAKAGFQIIKDKGIFGKELGYVSKYDASLLRDSLTPEFQTINMMAKATGFDALTSLFKRSVTGIFLPFHTRNYVSGIIQNFEALGPDALNPKNIAAGQKLAYLMGKNAKIPSSTMEVGGKVMKLKDVMKPFINRFSGDTFYNNDFLDALKNGGSLSSAEKVFSKASLKKTFGFQKGAVIPVFNEQGLPMKMGRAVGQFIEHQQKATAYITALGQGKNIDDALKLAEVAGFDYRALTRFESQILRRIIPFYSFTRKNIELQLKTLGENPQRINQVLKFFQNLGEPIPQDEKANLPDYLKESIGVKLPDSKDGLKQYLSSFGTPIEQFAQLFGKNPVLRTISQMNPLIKAPIEIGIGKDSFRQRDLKTVYSANEYKMAPQVIKDLLQLKVVKKPILKKMPDGSYLTIGTRDSYVANPERLLIARSLFTSRGVSYLDQAFGGDMKGFVKSLKLSSGLKPQQIDIEQLTSINENQMKRDLEDLLTRYGITRQFTKTYVPK